MLDLSPKLPDVLAIELGIAMDSLGMRGDQ